MSVILKASTVWPAPVKMSYVYLHVLMSHRYSSVLSPKCSKIIRMTDSRLRAVGRHMLSNLPCGTWENVDSAHLSEQNENGFCGEHRPILPIASTSPDSLCCAITREQPIIVQHPFPSAHPDLCFLQQNNITRVQSTSQAGDMEAQIAWIWKKSLTVYNDNWLHLRFLLAHQLQPLLPLNPLNVCCGSSGPLPDLARAQEPSCSQQLVASSWLTTAN